VRCWLIMLALGVQSGRVMMVDGATGEGKWAVQAYFPGTDSRSRVAMSPGDGKFVASVGFDDGRWKLWDSASGAVHRVGATHDGTGACTCTMPTREDGCPVVAHTGGICAVAFTPCGQTFATGGQDGAVIMWDVQTGAVEYRLQGGSSCCSVSFSAEGARLASGHADCSIRVWDAKRGVILRTIPAAHVSFMTSVNFSPINDRILVTKGGDSHIHVWDIESGEKVRSMAGLAFAAFSPVLSPDGRTVAIASTRDARDVHLVDVESGALLLEMAGKPPTLDP